MFQKMKTQFKRAWQWTLAHLPFGRKEAKNPVTSLMDDVEQRYQAFQQRQRAKRFKRQAAQYWSRFQKRVGQAFTRAQAWIKAHRRALLFAAVGLGVVLVGLAGLILWRRSPVLRTALATAFGAVAAIAAARTTQSVPTVLTTQVAETAETVPQLMTN
jgi:hypothetical protein